MGLLLPNVMLESKDEITRTSGDAKTSWPSHTYYSYLYNHMTCTAPVHLTYSESSFVLGTQLSFLTF